MYLDSMTSNAELQEIACKTANVSLRRMEKCVDLHQTCFITATFYLHSKDGD